MAPSMVGLLLWGFGLLHFDVVIEIVRCYVGSTKPSLSQVVVWRSGQVIQLLCRLQTYVLVAYCRHEKHATSNIYTLMIYFFVTWFMFRTSMLYSTLYKHIYIYTYIHTKYLFFLCGWNFIQFRVVAALNSAFLARTNCAPCFHGWGNHWANVCFQEIYIIHLEPIDACISRDQLKGYTGYHSIEKVHSMED